MLKIKAEKVQTKRILKSGCILHKNQLSILTKALPVF